MIEEYTAGSNHPRVTLRLMWTDGSWLLDSLKGGLGYMNRKEDGICYLAVSAHVQANLAQLKKLLAIRSTLSYLHSCLIYANAKIAMETDCKGSIFLIEGQQDLA